MKFIKLILSSLAIQLLSCTPFGRATETVKGEYKISGKEFYFSVVELKYGALSQSQTVVRRVFNDKTYEIALSIDKTGNIEKFEVVQDSVLLALNYFKWHDSTYQETHKFHVYEKINNNKYKL